MLVSKQEDFDRLNALLPDGRLSFLRRGIDRQIFHPKRRDRASLPGTMSQEDLPWIYASSDIFVFPSRSEVSPNVVLEARASGLPVVVADRNGGGPPPVAAGGKRHEPAVLPAPGLGEVTGVLAALVGVALLASHAAGGGFAIPAVLLVTAVLIETLNQAVRSAAFADPGALGVQEGGSVPGGSCMSKTAKTSAVAAYWLSISCAVTRMASSRQEPLNPTSHRR